MAEMDTEVTEDRFIMLRDGCRRLGVSIREARRNPNDFPKVFTIGGRLKFRESDIAAYIRNGGHVDDA